MCFHIASLTHGNRSFRPISCSPGGVSFGLRVDLPGAWKSFHPNIFLLDLRIKKNKSSSRFFLIGLMMSLTQINRRQSCVNIPRSKKGAHKHKYKRGLSVRAKRLPTAGEMTPGEQDIGRNDRNSSRNIHVRIRRIWKIYHIKLLFLLFS